MKKMARNIVLIGLLLTLSLTAQEESCDIVMFGHTHVPCPLCQHR